MSYHVRKIVVISATLAIVLSSGCATRPYPYFEVGAGYTISKSGVLDSLEGYGSDPTAHLAIGAEGKLTCLKINHSIFAEWDHQSHYFDGRPFNNNPEGSKDEFVIGIKIGGLPK